ncbi:dTDP-4-dehydrorhamnose 3,5-epimerase [Nitratireductor thuwali]|uniref:dTDP-4-dehydrorhamnose 3,5-epimerase n=1 Tax=Nitratireductor thuwali TaxID=2267699 RepID=A0ABY5MM66_9HYPH|nr:dTDP-4-dehydrorhamnose 3,5-epimerase [Nitratireductor thuwali]
MIEVRALELEDVLEIVPRKFGDERGYFCETYHRARYASQGIAMEFVQDNQSYSAQKGVLRGLHYQLPPRAQDKLVRVLKGRIYDVAVDIRRASATFGRWVGLEISAAKGNQILVPKGFAHGFVTLEEHTIVSYKVSDYYSPEHDCGILYNDPEIGIDWPIMGLDLQLSKKDSEASPLRGSELF